MWQGIDKRPSSGSLERRSRRVATLARVVRYEVPNLQALNFLLYDVLGGGASRSLRSDNQGKTLALALLQMEVERPSNYQAMRRP